MILKLKINETSHIFSHTTTYESTKNVNHFFFTFFMLNPHLTYSSKPHPMKVRLQSMKTTPYLYMPRMPLAHQSILAFIVRGDMWGWSRLSFGSARVSHRTWVFVWRIYAMKKKSDRTQFSFEEDTRWRRTLYWVLGWYRKPRVTASDRCARKEFVY